MRARLDPGGAGAAALLLALVVLAYANALNASFQFDDFQMIVDNPKVHGLAAWWHALPGIRPLLKLSYALNWTLSPAPWSWHAFDISVHLMNTLLVFGLAHYWQRDLLLPPARGHAFAFAVAALFALHPATTEAVTYASGRSISLMALFYLAALTTQRYAEDAPRPGRWRVLACTLFAMALATRETAVTLPAALLLYALLRGRTWRDALASLHGHAAILALGAIAMLLTPGYRSFFGWSLLTRDLVPQLRGQLQAHAYLVMHPLFGLQTNIDPGLRVADTLPPSAIAFAVCATVALAMAWRLRHRHPWLAFGLGWYFLQLGPSNSLLPRFDLANDRHLYLALPGIALMVAAGLRRLRPTPVATGVLMALLLLLVDRTWRRNADYRDETSLWIATVHTAPHNPRAWNNLGYARQLANDFPGARQAYACALALDPGYRQALINDTVLAERAPRGNPSECAPRRSE